MKSTIVLESEITCPACGHKKTESMPTDACQWLYECEKCGVILSPKKRDCCVFCSSGTVACPPIQVGSTCCLLCEQRYANLSDDRCSQHSKRGILGGIQDTPEAH